jgi:hypothetical protein
MRIRLCLLLVLLTAPAACKDNPLASFREINVEVLAAGGGGGSVTSNDAAVAIDCAISSGVSGRGCSDSFRDAGAGGGFSLTAVPDAGSEFVSWSGCGSVSGRTCTLAFTLGDGRDAFRVTVNFRRIGAEAAYDANLLQNPGFETAVAVGGLPTAVGRWQGDSAARWPAGGDFTPRNGASALRFLTSGPAGATAAGVSSQQWQIIDLTPLAADIDAGRVRAEGQAWFYRAPNAETTDDRFDLRLGAFRGVPSEFPLSFAAPSGVRLADEVSSVVASPARWTQAQRAFTIPAGARYIVVEIYAYENRVNDATFPEFDGHYADDISLVLRRAP